MGRLSKKIAVVTGAAKGIGYAIAKRLIHEGATVWLTDIDKEAGEKAAKELGATFFHHDVCSEDQWRALFKEIGHLNVLVNNAGVMGLDFGAQDPEHASLESWKRVHAINLDSVFLGCKYGIEKMKKQGGSIINLSSRSGMVGVPNAAAYASSKAAIRNHTKSVALYCAGKAYNIRCNSIHPATIMTPLWKAMIQNEKELHQLEKGIPLHRFGTPEDVAALALYLASEESSYVTGGEFTIDGGILAGSTSAPGKR